MEPFYQQQPLRFDCTRCGACCAAGGGYYLFLTEAEAESIRGYLNLSRGWFYRRYLERLEDGELVAATAGDGGCVFLGKEGRCRVYPVRPAQCRSYPFWPEIVRSRTAWRRESMRCEGIGRGNAVSLATIRKLLDSC